jgi:sn-glycerol 3-phosphate transport system substrate-binding protein
MTLTTRRSGQPLVALLAVLALLAAACGDDGDGGGGGGGDDGGGDAAACPVDALDDAEGPVEITFWHAMGGAELERTMIQVTDAYNQSQDLVRVNLVNQQGYEDNFTAFRDAAAGDRPNVLQLPEYRLQAMSDSGLVISAADCVEASGFDLSALLPRALEYYTLEDTFETMPFNVSGPVLYYNRTMFEAAGLDPDDPPATLQEIREASQAIVDSGAATYGIALETGFDSFGGWVTEQFFAGQGELYADNDNGRSGRATEVLFNSEFGVETYTFLRDLVADGLAVNVGENPDGLDALFKMADLQEPAAMAIYTSAGVSSVLGFLEGGLVPGLGPDELGVGRLPSGGGVTVGGASLYMVADQPDVEIAATWDFIEYLVSAETQSVWAAGTGYVPINTGALEVAPLSDTYATDPRFRVAYDQLIDGETNAATAGPVLGPLREIRTVIAEALQDVLSAGADPQEALDAAKAEADLLVEDYANRTGTG